MKTAVLRRDRIQDLLKTFMTHYGTEYHLAKYLINAKLL
ncbi:hypothetical protein C1752_01482 [Acaryochloris thomasi RCC1774]|uniref:Uncharacterized protein n=1 Tax=Acaryochloris thomasi RCC1774 TaxID=1764569 RepID=A0A2W1K399_9CYAN|nr:hypothetical protein C1752_01482 [Acaryochloris thomasi RCC1774]